MNKDFRKKNEIDFEEKKEEARDNTKKSFFIAEDIKKNKEKLTPKQVILSLLRERNWKQTNLADAIGMTPQGLNNYLRGFWTFPTSVKIKIAQALEVDSSVIWDLEK